MDAEQGEAYLIQDSLSTSGTDLLPVNTKIFPSTVRYGRPFYFIGLGSVVVSFLLVIVGGALSSNGIGPIIIGAAFGSLLIGAVVMAVIARRATLRHIQQQAVGEWHEGVIVFPSGDVVVRFIGSFWGSTDTTIEAVYLSRADVVRACSPWRCLAPRNHLVIRYLGIDARPGILSICDIDLKDDVAQVAQHINELKAIAKGTRGF